jgi:SAM-dependent methyltransferase
VQCTICLGDSHRFLNVRGYWVRACVSCGHQFAEITPTTTHVADVYSDAYFTSGGSGYADYCSEGDLLRAQGRCYAGIVGPHIQAPGTMLDVGSAAGFLLAGFCDCGWTGQGIEPNHSMAEYGREHLGLHIQTGTLGHVDYHATFDLVTMIQVIAHLPDPAHALGTARRILRNGGLLLVETWNRDSLCCRLLRSNWHEYAMPAVLHWFSKRGLVRLAASHGFHLIAEGRPSKRIRLDHAFSAAAAAVGSGAARTVIQAAGRLLPRRTVVPYPGDDVFWMLFQEQYNAGL